MTNTNPASGIELPVTALQPGNILAEDIGLYDSLRAGTVLTEALIGTIKAIPGLRGVRVQPPETESAEPAPAAPAQLRDGADLSQHNQSLGNMISDRIAAALHKDPEVTTSNLEAVSESKNIDLANMDRHERDEAMSVINYVNQAMADIKRIESGPVYAKEPLHARMESKVTSVDTIYAALLDNRQAAVQALEKVINDFITETGPNRDSSILLKDVLQQPDRFLANHCMNVAIVALATAIELTKIMEEKLNDPSLAKDIRVLQSIRFKTFSHEELVKLGFAAFVHDIYLKKAFPRLRPTDRLDAQADRSNIERHPSESYHLMKKFEMDYHVNKAVLQHHERVDGSGYPDGVGERLFSKYTPVISFADRYISLTQPNPFAPVLHPTAALKRLLTAEKKGFDSDVILSFARAATMVPIGSWVQLEDGLVGYATRRLPGHNLPVIRLVLDNAGRELDPLRETDPNQPGQRITRLLMPADVKALNGNYMTYYTI